jgi:ABC-type microcin C transport system duplicated ATPase subunit YejF
MSNANGSTVLYDEIMVIQGVSMRVVIAKHSHLSCLEIIAFNNSQKIEAPRIYVNYPLLRCSIMGGQHSRLVIESCASNSCTAKLEMLNLLFQLTTRIIVAKDFKDQFVVRLSPVNEQEILDDKLSFVFETVPTNLNPHKIIYDILSLNSNM